MSDDPREIDTADIQAEAMHARADSSRMKWVAMLLGLIAVAAIAYSVTSFVGAREDAQRGEKRAQVSEKQAQADSQVVGDQAADQSDRILAICKGDTKEAKKLDEAGLCGSATETKDLVEKQVPPAGARNGVDGQDATIAQVFAAVQRFGPAAIAAYCAKNDDCMGDPGSNVTQAELAAAINGQAPQLLAAYCAANNNCRGLKGDKGDAVKGDAGKNGTNGTNGTDGRGIASLACAGSLTPLTLTLTYSDGTTTAVECGPTPEPDPEPAP